MTIPWDDINAFLQAADWLPLAVGVALLLFGGLLYWISIHAAGAGIVGGGCLLIVVLVADAEEWTGGGALAAKAGATLVGTAVGIFLVRQVHRVLFFLFGALTAGLLVFLGLQWLRTNVEELPGWLEGDLVLALVPPLAGLAGGVLLLAANRLVIAGSTALLGAVLASQALGMGTGAIPVVPIAASGFVFQMVLGKIRRERRRQRAAVVEEEAA